MTAGATGGPGWERFEAEGGVGIVGRGRTLPEAFAQTVLAMFGVITDLDGVETREVREVRAHGDSLPTLLATWLNECLYVHEVEGFVARDVELVALDERPRVGGEPFRIHAILRGEEMDPARHSRGLTVTEARSRGVSVERTEVAVETRVVLSAH